MFSTCAPLKVINDYFIIHLLYLYVLSTKILYYRSNLGYILQSGFLL